MVLALMVVWTSSGNPKAAKPVLLRKERPKRHWSKKGPLSTVGTLQAFDLVEVPNAVKRIPTLVLWVL